METKQRVTLGLLFTALTIVVAVALFWASESRQLLSDELGRTIQQRDRLEDRLDSLQSEREHLIDRYVPGEPIGEKGVVEVQPASEEAKRYQVDLAEGSRVVLFDGELTVEVQEMSFLPDLGGYEALLALNRIGAAGLTMRLPPGGTETVGGFEVQVISTRPRGARVKVLRSTAEKDPLDTGS